MREGAVLGACLRDNGLVDDIAPMLGVENFLTNAGRWVWEAIVALHAAGKPADLVAVADELNRRGRATEVGYAHLATLWEDAASSQMAVEHARQIKDASLIRSLSHAAKEIIRRCESR